MWNLEKKGLEDGSYTVVFLSPEILDSIDKWRFFLESSAYTDAEAMLAVDEAHLLHSWGEEFRPALRRIVELRSFFSGAPVLVLSATCTSTVRQSLLQKLQLSSDIDVEWEVPNRPNIHLHIKSEAGMDLTAMQWYFDEVKSKGLAVEKAVIYVNGITQMSRLAIDIMGELGQSAYVGNEKIFKMYHSGMSRADLDGILASFADPESKSRFLIATIAFGIGINIPDIRFIMHWGAPKTVEDYWQEVGRAGRDGKPAQAKMYATKVSLINCSKEIQGLVKTDSCYRQYILDLLSFTQIFKAPIKLCNNDRKCEQCNCPVCSCCSNCKRQCPCYFTIS